MSLRKSTLATATALGVVASVVSWASAQQMSSPTPPGVPGGVNVVTVLMAPAVQDELKLSADQKTQVFELAREAQQKGRAMLQTAIQSRGNPQAFMAAGMRLRQETEAAAAKILQPEQKERVDQIMLQIEGPLAVVRPEVAAKLNMTPKQSQQAQVTVMQMGQAVREMLMEQAASGVSPALGAAGLPREALDKLRGAATQQLGRVLDAKQKFQFNKLLGEPFDLAKINPDFARPAASSSAASETGASGKAERSKGRRKGVSASTKAADAKDAGDDETPKP